MEDFVVRTLNRGVREGLVCLTPEGNYKILTHRGWKEEAKAFKKWQKRYTKSNA